MKKSFATKLFIIQFMRSLVITCTLLCVLLSVSLALPVKAQHDMNRKISIKMDNGSLIQFIREVEKLTSYSFVIANKDDVLTSKVNIQAKDQPLGFVLQRVLAPMDLAVTEAYGQLIVKRVQAPVPVRRGAVSGFIRDAGTGETLPYASISIKGTGTSVVTDANGHFIFSSLEEGSVILKISYLGYKPVEKPVTVNGGKTTAIEIKLESAVNTLAGISITGIRRGEVIALNDMRNADNIKYVLSQEQIERFPDATVGEALQRAPGVAMDYSYGLPKNVVIRGLDQSLGSVTMNGNKLPSTETNSRTMDLNGVLSATVEAIEVHKTLTPDMDADGTAGSVNIITKTPKKGMETMEAKGSFGNNFLIDKGNYEGALSYGNRKDKWGYLVSANYSNSRRGEDRAEKDYKVYKLNGQSQTRLSSLSLEGTDIKRKNTGVQAELNYYPDEKTRFYFRGAYNNYYEVQTRANRTYSVGGYSSDDEVNKVKITGAGTPRDYHRDLLTLTLGTKKEFGKWKADADLTYTGGLYDQPIYFNGSFSRSDLSGTVNLSNPEAPVFNFTQADAYTPSTYTAKSYINRHQMAHDKDGQLSFNATRAFELNGENSGIFKFGGRFKYKTYDHTRNYFQHAYSGTFYLSDYLSSFSRTSFFDGNYDLSSAIPDGYKLEEFYKNNTGLFTDNETYTRQNTDPDSYKGNENLTAGYVMTRFNLSKFEFTGGVRYEATGFDYKGNVVSFDENGDYIETKKVDVNSVFDGFFPSLNIKYALNKSTNFRAAATRSLSRPGYYDLVPWEEIEPEGQSIGKGNPDLKQATSSNYDLLFEHYLKSVGLISGGLFYKSVDNYIYERTYIQQGGEYDQWEVTQTVNGAAAKVYGFEVAWQQQLTFLPGLLNGLGIYANYTQIGSRFKVPGVESERTVRLPDMRPKVGNVSLSYEKFGFSGRLSLNFYDTFISELSETAENDLMEQGRKQLDFSASQKINRQVTLFMGISNINNAQVKINYRDGRPNDHKFYSSWANIGIKYRPF